MRSQLRKSGWGEQGGASVVDRCWRTARTCFRERSRAGRTSRLRRWCAMTGTCRASCTSTRVGHIYTVNTTEQNPTVKNRALFCFWISFTIFAALQGGQSETLINTCITHYNSAYLLLFNNASDWLSDDFDNKSR